MAVTRLKRKDRKNKARANNKTAKIKFLKSMPVIKMVDVEKIKEEFASGSTKAKKAEAPIKEEKPKTAAKPEEKATPKTEKKTAPKAEKKAAPSKEELAAKVDSLLKSMGTATEADKQDLKKISGIGPVFEKKLNSIGVFTYEQISKLTGEDMENLADIGGLTKNKIESEDWVSQAKTLLG